MEKKKHLWDPIVLHMKNSWILHLWIDLRNRKTDCTNHCYILVITVLNNLQLYGKKKISFPDGVISEGLICKCLGFFLLFTFGGLARPNHPQSWGLTRVLWVTLVILDWCRVSIYWSLKSKIFRIYQENKIIHKTIYLFTYKAALAQLNAIFRLQFRLQFLHGWFL